MSQKFLDQVVEAAGLSSVFGPSVISRACKRAGVDADRLDAKGLEKSLDSIESAIKVYLPPHEIEGRMAALRLLVRRAA